MTESGHTVLLRSYQPKAVIATLSNHFKVAIDSDCDEHTVVLPGKFGDLSISGVEFFDGYGLLSVKGCLKQDLFLKYPGNQNHPMRFLFCLEGSISHFMAHKNIQYELDALKGSITTAPGNADQVIRLPAALNLSITSLVIDRGDFLEKVDCNLETIPKQLSNVFRDTGSKSTFFYEGNFSIASAECIKKIHQNAYTGLTRMTYLESKALELFTYQLKQFKDDQQPTQRQVLLRKYDVEKIIKAKDFLLDNLQDAPGIKEMARQAGINENKLKKGFKLIFDSTINQYLRNERLEMAKLLLMENNRAVKEVAEMVGYNSLGHFARRFKEKFGVLPKDYVKNIKSKISDLETSCEDTG